MPFRLSVCKDLFVRRDCATVGGTYDISLLDAGTSFVIYPPDLVLYAVYEQRPGECITQTTGTFVWKFLNPASGLYEEFFRWANTEAYLGYVFSWARITRLEGGQYRVDYSGYTTYFTVTPAPLPPETLTFFADIAEFFHSIADFWLIGPVLGLIGDGFDLADEWLVWVNSLADQIPSMATVKGWILGSYTDLASWLTAQESTVKGWILGSYTDLASWLTAQESTVKAWILGEYASLDEWIDAQQEKVIAWVKSAVVELLDELISTVDDWVDDRIDAIKDLVEKIIMKL